MRQPLTASNSQWRSTWEKKICYLYIKFCIGRQLSVSKRHWVCLQNVIGNSGGQKILRGQISVDNKLNAGQIDTQTLQMGRKTSLKLFSGTELKIIKLICQELTSTQIATRLGLNKRTLEERRTIILRKTKSKNVVGIVKYAIKHGIVKLTIKKIK